MTPVQAVEQAADAYGLQSALCAVSGGADSVALLRALVLLREKRPLRLEAVHVQHGLRGADSLADEQWVRRLCDLWQVPLHVQDAGLHGSMEDEGIENLARQRRRQIFARLMRQRGLQALLTAHHLDDQAETVLMHLLRGAGMEGLCGMRPCAPFGCGVMVRPFLGLEKKCLTDWLAQQGIAYRQDASNQLAITRRNALRLELLPQIEALFPGAARHLAQTAEALSQDQAYLEAQAGRQYDQCLVKGPGVFALEKAPLQGSPLARRTLRRWWAEGLGQRLPDERGLSHADTLALEALLHRPPGSTVNLPGDLKAAAGARHLHLTTQAGQPLVPGAEREPLPVSADRAVYPLPWGEIRLAPYQGPPPRTADEAVLTPRLLAMGPVLRLPMAGDEIRPLGAPGAKPLRRYLMDRHVDAPFRRVLPVLAAGSQVLWVPGLCTAEALRQDAQCRGMRLYVSGKIPFLF